MQYPIRVLGNFKNNPTDLFAVGVVICHMPDTDKNWAMLALKFLEAARPHERGVFRCDA